MFSQANNPKQLRDKSIYSSNFGSSPKKAEIERHSRQKNVVQPHVSSLVDV